MKENNQFKKLTLLDLAAARIKNSIYTTEAVAGDIVRIIDPFKTEEDMMGIVLEVKDELMTVFHSDIKKLITWNRRVKCEVLVL